MEVELRKIKIVLQHQLCWDHFKQLRLPCSIIKKNNNFYNFLVYVLITLVKWQALERIYGIVMVSTLNV